MLNQTSGRHLQPVIISGVYVRCSDYFPFQVGPTQTSETLGAVRLGGHREAHETGWECAAREAWEEASIRVTPLAPPATYWVEVADEDTLQAGT
jgi:8-oxo-dGTP pyrophosphatase MutT (NUDIX family)